jgi:hypothetical protein
MNEWWSQQDGALIGAIGGSAIGILGALFGSLVGYFAPRGKCKGFIIPFHLALVIIGAATLCAGITALILKQPYHVWYPLTLCGFILTVVLGCLFPVVSKRYADADRRKLDAEQLRRG